MVSIYQHVAIKDRAVGISVYVCKRNTRVLADIGVLQGFEIVQSAYPSEGEA